MGLVAVVHPSPNTDDVRVVVQAGEAGCLLVPGQGRPDAFEADDPRAGEADLIIAKHRNGPTTTISVAHQLHYSRFTDLAAQ